MMSPWLVLILSFPCDYECILLFSEELPKTLAHSYLRLFGLSCAGLGDLESQGQGICP